LFVRCSTLDVNSPPALAAHKTAVARDLALLNLPPANWLASVKAPDNSDALDVAIVGAGMLGIAAAAALIFKGVRNIRLFDRASGAGGALPGHRSPHVAALDQGDIEGPQVHCDAAGIDDQKAVPVRSRRGHGLK
jgi:hypothetical protein